MELFTEFLHCKLIVGSRRILLKIWVFEPEKMKWTNIRLERRKDMLYTDPNIVWITLVAEDIIPSPKENLIFDDETNLYGWRKTTKSLEIVTWFHYKFHCSLFRRKLTACYSIRNRKSYKFEKGSGIDREGLDDQRVLKYISNTTVICRINRIKDIGFEMYTDYDRQSPQTL